MQAPHVTLVDMIETVARDVLAQFHAARPVLIRNGMRVGAT